MEKGGLRRVAGNFFNKKKRLMLRFKVLFDQKLDKRMEQGLSSLASVMNELKKNKIKRELLL